MSDRHRRGGETVGGREVRLAKYRYRTPVLTGPWRDSRAQALRDAVAASQAREDPNEPFGVRWLVPGEIEEEAEEPPRAAGANGR